MIRFLARSNYLREVQRTFGSAGNLDLTGLLEQVLSVIVPVIVVGILWRYRHRLFFFAGRILAVFFGGKSRRAVENYLVTRGPNLEIFAYSGGAPGRKICDARVASVENGRMKLQLFNVTPSSARLGNTQLLCLTKPFVFDGKRMNGFVTLPSRVRKKGILLKELSLLTPIRYRFVVRRRHSRQRVAREGAVRLKAWSGRKAGTFWMVRPELQTVNNPARYGEQTRVVVENISAGGLRMFVVNPKGSLPSLQKGNQLVLRVSIWNPATRKYSFFTAIGTIRSRFSGRGGAIGLGIQFTSEGEKVGNRYHWHSVQGEIKSLAKFMAQLEE